VPTNRQEEMKWADDLRQHVERRPLVLLRIGEDETPELMASRHGMGEFTLSRTHAQVEGAQTPCLCLVFTTGAEGGPMAYAAVLKSRERVTTLASRIKVKRSVLIEPHLARRLPSMLGSTRFARDLKERLATNEPVLVLPPQLSLALLNALLEVPENIGPLRSVSGGLVKPSTATIEGQQSDALDTALKAFGLTSDAVAVNLDLATSKTTSLVRARVMEDAVIEHDARRVPGYTLVGSDITGRAVFRNGLETLEVITANRRRLEQALGVDLIFFNEFQRTVVMVQYKMLNPSNEDGPTDWLYREDSHLHNQLSAMRFFSRRERAGEYKLNRDAFYFKFVRRRRAPSRTNVMVPLEHFEGLLQDESLRSRNGAVKLSYEALGGRYMRQTAFFSLLQSGYIGADARTTEDFRTLVEEILEGNDALVLAIQRATSEYEQEEDRRRSIRRNFSS
jgi:hypothetical protein